MREIYQDDQDLFDCAEKKVKKSHKKDLHEELHEALDNIKTKVET